MIHPDDDDKPFVARWNTLVNVLLIEPSIKLVARTACDYGIRDGENIYPGNERLARLTSLSGKTIREAWHFLGAAGMAHRDVRSAWTGTYRTADLYVLDIPGHWKNLPILGSTCGKFTCQQCGKKFNSPPCNVFLHERRGSRQVPVTDTSAGLREVRWALWKTVFCPAPRQSLSCRQKWEKENGLWQAADNDACWALFHKARDDDWPDMPCLRVA